MKYYLMFLLTVLSTFVCPLAEASPTRTQEAIYVEAPLDTDQDGKLDRIYIKVLSFSLEPKQHTFAAGSQIGILVTATYNVHTIRPDAGTRIKLNLGQESFIQLRLSEPNGSSKLLPNRGYQKLKKN